MRTTPFNCLKPLRIGAQTRKDFHWDPRLSSLLDPNFIFVLPDFNWFFKKISNPKLRQILEFPQGVSQALVPPY